MNSFVCRPTTLAAALVDAAVKVDHKSAKDLPTWVAKQVINNCDRDGFGIVKEQGTNAKLSFKTAKKLGLA